MSARTLRQIEAGRVVVVFRETFGFGKSVYVVEGPAHLAPLHDRSACVATSRAGLRALIDALENVASDPTWDSVAPAEVA